MLKKLKYKKIQKEITDVFMKLPGVIDDTDVSYTSSMDDKIFTIRKGGKYFIKYECLVDNRGYITILDWSDIDILCGVLEHMNINRMLSYYVAIMTITPSDDSLINILRDKLKYITFENINNSIYLKKTPYSKNKLVDDLNTIMKKNLGVILQTDMECNRIVLTENIRFHQRTHHDDVRLQYGVDGRRRDDFIFSVEARWSHKLNRTALYIRDFTPTLYENIYEVFKGLDYPIYVECLSDEDIWELEVIHAKKRGIAIIEQTLEKGFTIKIN